MSGMDVCGTHRDMAWLYRTARKFPGALLLPLIYSFIYDALVLSVDISYGYGRPHSEGSQDSTYFNTTTTVTGTDKHQSNCTCTLCIQLNTRIKWAILGSILGLCWSCVWLRQLYPLFL
ncbi:hypothetical protein EDD18DRAFT_512976 [Armillaria luteobubalina]|uniref:Uncharacterized protein n=1 Tax=Armillaria luteobubalina TaxID=153913 RepID=A0AA39PYA3_9AGAR|nr:hypothetical protein EDD18DRAFT_512976 [Armillaria luteobubalina]